MKAMDTEAGAPAHHISPPPQQYSTGDVYPPKPTSSTSSTKNLVSLILRVLTLIFLFVSLILLSLTKETLYETYSDYYTGYSYTSQEVVHFRVAKAYRYAMSAIVIGFVYTLVQIIFSVIRLVTSSLGGGDIMLIVSFYGDKLVSYLLATAAAAGFGIGVDGKDAIQEGALNDFLTKGNTACSIVFIAFLFTAASSILSSYALPRSSSRN